MRRQGNSVQLCVGPYANHDIFHSGGVTGFKVVNIAGKFLAARRGE